MGYLPYFAGKMFRHWTMHHQKSLVFTYFWENNEFNYLFLVKYIMLRIFECIINCENTCNCKQFFLSLSKGRLILLHKTTV